LGVAEAAVSQGGAADGREGRSGRGTVEVALLEAFLAVKTIGGPGENFQAAGGDVVTASLAGAEGAVVDASERGLDHTKPGLHLAALLEEAFLAETVQAEIGDVLGVFGVAVAGFGGETLQGDEQLVALALESFLYALEFCSSHDGCPRKNV